MTTIGFSVFGAAPNTHLERTHTLTQRARSLSKKLPQTSNRVHQKNKKNSLTPKDCDKCAQLNQTKALCFEFSFVRRNQPASS
jgi:hypothetical protein